jgi:CRP/FNR family transcriptional activator FtrB
MMPACPFGKIDIGRGAAPILGIGATRRLSALDAGQENRMRQSDREFVRQVPLLAELPEPAFAALLRRALLQSLPRTTVLCEQGETPEYLHIVLSGSVTLVGRSTAGDETVVDFFGPGDVLIAPAVMLDAPYLASARVVNDARIAFIPADDVRQAMATVPAFNQALAIQLALYWRRFIRQIKELKLLSAPERVAGFLVSLSSQCEGGAKVTLPEDRKQVAARLGMTPESLSRAFVTLRPLGVAGKGRQVTIADIARLAAYCHYDRVL